MLPIRTPLIIILGLAGGATGAQAPEFAQQYRQRLGGAVAELRTVAQDFDRDAQAEGLERPAALQQLKQSPDALARRRGTTMDITLNRFEKLRDQSVALERARPMTRPIEVLRYPDPKIVGEAWDSYEPGLPLTQHGLAWGFIGAFGALVFAWGFTRPFRRDAKGVQDATNSRV